MCMITMCMMKKKTLIALVLLFLIPFVWMLGGWLLRVINPDSAAGHPNYAQNYRFLSRMKQMSLWGTEAAIAVLWLLVCFLVIRAKKRSSWWMLLAAFGPFGFAIMAALRDEAPAENDRHERFVRNLNWFVRIGYQLCVFVVIWMLAYQAMVVKRNLMIRHQSAVTGMSVAQIIDIQNASSGMWAFAEGDEEMYMVVVLYLLWPMVFNLASRTGRRLVSQRPSRRSMATDEGPIE